MQELKFRKLDVAKYDEGNPNFIATRYFLELVNYIGVSTSAKIKSKHDEAIKNRRAALKSGNEEEYTNIVR